MHFWEVAVLVGAVRALFDVFQHAASAKGGLHECPEVRTRGGRFDGC